MMNAREHEAQHLLKVYGQLPIEPTHAKGVYLTYESRQILDLYGGHAVAALGYGHPDMLKTLNEQAQTLFFQSNAVAMEVRAEAADALADFAPAGLNHVFFANSGAEVNENALRLACKLTGRSRVAAIKHGFHGRTAAAGAVSWGARDKWYGFPNTPFEVDFIDRNVLADVTDKVSYETAAVILELVQGLAGGFDLNSAFIHAIADACADKGALLIVDEVQTGMGRCGQAFATDLYNIKPDILTVAKSIAGGFPCAALIVTDAIASEIGPGDLGSTFGGGPLACALVKTVIDVIERDQLMRNVRVLSGYIEENCPVGPVDRLQGKGFLLGLKCRRPAIEVRNELLDRNILVGTSTDPHVIRLLPPLITEEKHFTRLIESLAELPEI
ncbi:MAG: aminotransferase class III-fold pyridoxal phosphate-dependent enzyme [Gammaproteobacteria bacterium]|jgi:acetylornithine/succinyldiaminopimelate/putrescine aminotransferase|nr:aminotransferase class III-fold pyridoxal phosphate-dependent enzyme [Gammaproteobacteria bacterium]